MDAHYSTCGCAACERRAIEESADRKLAEVEARAIEFHRIMHGSYSIADEWNLKLLASTIERNTPVREVAAKYEEPPHPLEPPEGWDSA
jgi:hypothetical protein